MSVDKRTHCTTGLIICIPAIVLFFCTLSSNAGVGQFQLNNPYWYTDLDAAGYADICYWGWSPRHPYWSHEMLSGEWGAAIYYDGIDTDPIDANEPDGPRKAMWLTDEFIEPNWDTDNDFNTESYDVWNDPDNPIWPDSPAGKYDTGQSVISNDQVRVTVDYEMVDLGEQGPNGEGGSLLAFAVDGIPLYVNSERYVLLQTYTITNIDSTDVNNVEFYQMLHGHPTGTYAAVVSSTYETTQYNDPLEDYVPYNSIHTVGNFRYDITQWNDYPNKVTANHKDWMGFSCAVQPDVIENGYYRGHDSGKPTEGTHENIEKRNLNGSTSNYDDEVAGTMGWYLGALAPNESKSVTVVVMFGAGPVLTEFLEFSKADDIDPDCAAPRDYVTYTISYGNPDANDPDYMGDATEVVITDYLPVGLEPIEELNDANTVGLYDPEEHTVTWDIRELPAGASGSVELMVRINRDATPGQTITNRSKITYKIGQLDCSQERQINTDVCDCSECGEIIYVDKYVVPEPNDGSSWQRAFDDLTDGLEAAYPCDEIWVADGTYKPPAELSGQNATFQIINAVTVYGGFAGGEEGEENLYERDWLENPTTLSGQIDANNVNYVVTLLDDTGLLPSAVDGFKITGGAEAGVYCPQGSPLVQHDIITNNGYGILAEGNAAPAIRNNWIYENTSGGILLDNASSETVIRNNTIADNSGPGINLISGSDPNITNCIIWGHDDANDLRNCWATYSCIQDSGDADPVPPYYNINTDPNFVNAGNDNYHLLSNSLCIDAGDPNITYGPYFGESDIDHRQRVANERVDMGADEYCDGFESNYADFDIDGAGEDHPDGRVNFKDYAVLAEAWLATTGSGDWNPDCDIAPPSAPDGSINGLDLDVFTDPNNWLWQACWTTPLASEIDIMMSIGGGGMGGMMSMGGGEGWMMSMGMGGEAMFAQSTSQQPTAEASEPAQSADIDEIVEWLEDLWLEEGEIGNATSEQEWREFIDSVKASAEAEN